MREDVEGALDGCMSLYRERRDVKVDFMTEQMEHFLRAIVAALAAEGRIALLFLTLGGVRVAAVLCFHEDGEALLYNRGYEPD